MNANLSRGSIDPPEASPKDDDPITIQQALIIGIDDYGTGFTKLANAGNDAKVIANMLSLEYGFQLLPADIASPLLDQQAKLEKIQQVVKESLQRASASTRWLFYFAGHGIVVDDTGYLIPADAQPGIVDTYLPIPWLLGESLKSTGAEILIILDTCYSGRALVRGEMLDDQTPSADFTRVRQVISSGNPRQPVLDGGGSGHSVFTQALLDGLKGRSGIHESDGRVRFMRLLDHLVYEVPGRLREAKLSAAEQQPIGGYFIGNSERREFVFQPIVKRLPPEIVRDLHSEDPSRRVSSLKQLSQVVSPETHAQAVEMAIHHLQSNKFSHSMSHVGRLLRYEPAAEVRAQAAATLGDLAAPAAIELLIATLVDVPDVCRAAARALGRLADQHAVPALLERLRSADTSLFLDLVGDIGAIAYPPATIEALRESLRRGRLVPFVGPDYPQALTGLPDRLTITHKLAEHENLAASDSLAQIALGTMRGENRYTFTAFLRDQLDDQLKQPGSIHQALTKLKAPFWISSAYDHLLPKALEANRIISGEDTRYWKANRPTVVQLVGEVAGQRELLVIENDYERLREREGDRRLLVSFLRNELQGKVVLFLGHDPNSPDFGLLVKHILNGHLAGLDVRAFLLWLEAGPDHTWSEYPIRIINQESLEFINQW